MIERSSSFHCANAMQTNCSSHPHPLVGAVERGRQRIHQPGDGRGRVERLPAGADAGLPGPAQPRNARQRRCHPDGRRRELPVGLLLRPASAPTTSGRRRRAGPAPAACVFGDSLNPVSVEDRLFKIRRDCADQEYDAPIGSTLSGQRKRRLTTGFDVQDMYYRTVSTEFDSAQEESD